MDAPNQARRLTTVHLFWLLPWVAVVIAALQPIRDNSFLWHIRAGEIQSGAGQVLTVDPFSHTFVGEAWRTQSWLADLLYAWLHGLSGLSFVPWLIVAAALTTIGLVGRVAYLVTRSLVATTVALLFTTWLGIAYFSPRPVLFSYALLALTMVILESERRQWSLPLVIWLWASLHGSFVIGIGLIVLYGLARRRPVMRSVGVSAVAASLTAHGIGIWMTLGAFVANRDALDLITEWAPPNLTSPDLAPYLVLIALVIIGASMGRISRRDLWIVIPFLVFGLTAARSLYPAAIVLAPFAARTVGSGADSRLLSRATALPVTLAAGIAIIALPFLVGGPWIGLSESRFPTGIDPEGVERPFHDDIVGGYLIYAHPDVPVFVDDRAELFGAEHFADMIQARNARSGWEVVFERHGITHALLDQDDGLVTVLNQQGWTVADEDENFVLMTPP